jgi:SAM-dependent methyltransferase
MSTETAESMPAQAVESCWCRSSDLVPAAHPGYLLCRECGTAKLRAALTVGQGPIRDEQAHLYDDAYWNEHQTQLGLSRITERARTDLAIKVPHWLTHLFKYSLPPGRALEIGCAHGGLVKFLELAGYDSLGIEMSPGIIKQTAEWFGVHVLQGPLEDVKEPLGLFDLIILFDVLEHLTEPRASLSAIAAHTGPGGVLAIQTPCHDRATDGSWPMYVAPEHTFLFSARGIEQLLHDIGFDHVRFEQQLLYGQNMFVFASREPLRENTADAIADALSRTTGGRIVQAMMDVQLRFEAAQRDYLDRLQDVRQLDLAKLYGTKRLACWLIRSAASSLARYFGLHR